MVDLDCHADVREGVTFVRLLVSNPTATARRVRIANRLDGPVWPPRCEGVPEAGWDDGGFEGVVAAGERLALGYACPEDSPDDSAQPADICWIERAESIGHRGDGGSPIESGERDAPTVEHSSAGVVRALGDPTPPADAVPVPEPTEDAASDSEERLQKRPGDRT